jgi:hypothetical protein
MIYTFAGLAGGSGAQRAGFNKGGDGDGKIRKKLSFAGAINNIAITHFPRLAEASPLFLSDNAATK